MAAAVAHLHGLSILHRDLKLGNVVVRQSDGEPLLLDFSCATYAQASELTDNGLPPGTDRFRAPQYFEHLRQYKEEHRARYAFQVADEVFAAGAMLYELLTDPQTAGELETDLRRWLGGHFGQGEAAAELKALTKAAGEAMAEMELKRPRRRGPDDLTTA